MRALVTFAFISTPESINKPQNFHFLEGMFLTVEFVTCNRHLYEDCYSDIQSHTYMMPKSTTNVEVSLQHAVEQHDQGQRKKEVICDLQ